MGDPARQNVLIYDLSGSYTEIAEALVGQFKSVMYFSQYQSAFKSARHYMPGVGLEGIERIEDPFDILDKVDLAVFPDVGMIGLQNWLRRQGIPVFGSGDGARLEDNRWLLRTVLRESGLDVTEAEMVHGIPALREYLKGKEDVFIKMSWWRGDFETFHHLNLAATQTWLDDLSARLGPYGAVADFIVEEPIDSNAVEIGIDGFCVDGEMLSPSLFGYEIKDSGYIGSTAELPERLGQVSRALAPVLSEIKYRGPLSNEVRVTKDKAYLIDFTARFPSPPSAVQTVLIENLAEIMSEGAEGRVVTPRFKALYAAQIILKSGWVEDHYLGLEIGEPEMVKIHGHCRIGGKDYAVSPSEIAEFGGACGIGNTIEDAMRQAVEAAESVKGFQVQYDSGALEAAIECIKDGTKLGLPFSSVIRGERILARA